MHVSSHFRPDPPDTGLKEQDISENLFVRSVFLFLFFCFFIKKNGISWSRGGPGHPAQQSNHHPDHADINLQLNTDLFTSQISLVNTVIDKVYSITRFSRIKCERCEGGGFETFNSFRSHLTWGSRIMWQRFSFSPLSLICCRSRPRHDAPESQSAVNLTRPYTLREGNSFTCSQNCIKTH